MSKNSQKCREVLEKVKGMKENRRCKAPGGCPKHAQSGGYCVKHGGTKVHSRCKASGCPKKAQKGGLCIAHGGTGTHTKCKFEGCTKHAQKGGLCVAHGGTKPKCKAPNCTKHAVKGGLCISHGGTQARSKGRLGRKRRKIHQNRDDDDLDDSATAGGLALAAAAAGAGEAQIKFEDSGAAQDLCLPCVGDDEQVLKRPKLLDSAVAAGLLLQLQRGE